MDPLLHFARALQRLYAHETNASTSVYAQNMISWWWNLMQIPAHQALHHLARHTRLVTNVDWSKQTCRHQCKHNWLTLASHGGCWPRQIFIEGHQLVSSMLRFPARRRSDLISNRWFGAGLIWRVGWSTFFSKAIRLLKSILVNATDIWSTLKLILGGDETIWSCRASDFTCMLTCATHVQHIQMSLHLATIHAETRQLLPCFGCDILAQLSCYKSALLSCIL